MIESMQNLLELQKLEFGSRQDDDTSSAIAALRAKIPPQILGHYDRLVVRGKKGIVPVQNQVCSGCHMRLPLAVVMTLKHDQDIQLCDTCGRYLYLPGGMENAPSDPPPMAKATRGRRRSKTSVVAT